MLKRREKIFSGSKKAFWYALFFLSGGSIIMGLVYHYKPLPAGLDYASAEIVVNIDDLSFLTDTAYQATNDRIADQRIWNTIFSQIDKAEQYILIDQFLFNDGYRRSAPKRQLAKELTDHLVAKKKSNPDIKIDFLVDPINSLYGALYPAEIERLKTAGVSVIAVDLNKLRDSNVIWSAPWRLLFSWFGSAGWGWLANPLDRQGDKITLRGYLAMLNFKADHRKVFMADDGHRLVSVIGSANAHGASTQNSNIAWRISGSFGTEVYRSEQAVAEMSGQSLSLLPENLQTDDTPGKNQFATVRLVTESRIKQAVLAVIDGALPGDSLDLAMFYLSDRAVIKALSDATGRGVAVRLILDPNQDAFGYIKNGIPNRPVAEELMAESNHRINIRWYDTGGEQFHSKFLLYRRAADNRLTVIAGSANFTKRNLDNYNLESDVAIGMNRDMALAGAIVDYFDRLWNNQDGRYTAEYDRYRDTSSFRYWQYRLSEFLGFGTF